jgi:hypothetical protein
LGYQVVAFDSARPLVEEMQALAADQPAVEALLGGYQSLPVLHRLNGEEVDLAARLEFDATYVGWASLSHLRSDAECVSLFTRLAALTAGPILLSYLPGPDTVGARAGFSVQIGFYRQLSGEHVRRLTAEAGLDVLSLQPDENWPRAVLRRPRETTPESEG